MAMLWRVGLCAYMATALPDMASYLLAPQPVLTLLSSVEPLLVSLLVALLLPRDAALITSQQSLATFLCVAGTLGTALFAPGCAELFGGAPAMQAPSKGIWSMLKGAEWF